MRRVCAKVGLGGTKTSRRRATRINMRFLDLFSFRRVRAFSMKGGMLARCVC